MKKTLLAAGAAIAALCFAGAAAAQAYNGDIDIVGSETQQCSVTPQNQDINWGDLPSNGAVSPASVPYTLYCNVTFDASVSVLNGRMLNASAPTGDVGPEGGPRENEYLPSPANTFYAALDYTISAPSLGLTVNSNSFDAGDGASGANLPPLSGTTNIVFNTVPLASGHLTAGTYSEKVTFTITPDGL